MWFEETHNDLYDTKVQNDKFALIAKMDERDQVVVKTPCGPTDEFTLKRICDARKCFWTNKINNTDRHIG